MATPRAARSADPSRQATLRRLWRALCDVEYPELPVSVVDLGLIVALAYDPASRRASVRLTFTRMGCPAMDLIQSDIRERLLRDPQVDSVDLEVGWDPIWTRRRLSDRARVQLRAIGVAP